MSVLPGGTTSRVRMEFRGRGMAPARDGESGSPLDDSLGTLGSLRDVEADQVPEGRLVDALVPRGEEGRGTLR